MDLKKIAHNKKLKERYNNDLEYREKKKKVAIKHYYDKKYDKDKKSIEFVREEITLYFL